MASNEAAIRALYHDGEAEDRRASSSRANHVEFHYTKKLVGEYIDQTTSVIELGCGTGYYGIHFAANCKEYVGVDLSPENIALFLAKIKKLGLCNVRALVGDATRLDQIEDGRFDVVLALGPMYHLPPDERERVFQECRRICKDSGIVVLAYINKTGAYIKGCLEFPDRYPRTDVNESVLKNGMDDVHPGVFFYTMPEEIAERAEAHGLSVLKNAGVDFVLNAGLINGMSEAQFEAWMGLADFMCGSESCTGLSNHALLICRKQKA